MKSIAAIPAFLLFLFSPVYLNAQITTASQWTWVKGASNMPPQFGIYGTMGTPADANTPGARNESVSWTDAAGNLWLFGGSGYVGLLNDLWKYNPATNQWTWINGPNSTYQPGIYGTIGIPAAANKPGCRNSSVSWTDATGNLWLFGGGGYAATSSGSLNDLWKYNPVTNQWTWVNGSNTVNQPGVYGILGTPAAANKPGARNHSVIWTDADGNLWLFGGFGYAASSNIGFLNDLWKYNPATNQWTWINGPNSTNQTSIYGTMGIPAVSNQPGARYESISWTDTAGNFWLFGGWGLATSNPNGSLNDLWKYNPVTNQWTWVNGADTANQAGVYGTLGIPDAANKPGARLSSVSWTDAAGHLLLFGGDSYTAISGHNYFNDFWEFNPATNQWTWVKGANTPNQVGVYGTIGMPEAANKPGARYESSSWTDAMGNLWLFGGSGYASNGSGVLNDLWKLSNVSPQFITANNGNWNNTNTWVGSIVPTPDAKVVVRHAVTVQTNTNCYSLKIEGPNGNVTVKTGVQLIVLH